MNTITKDVFGTVLNVPQVKPVYNLGSIKLKDLIKIERSKDTYDCVMNFFDRDTIGYQEQMIILYLNRNHRVLAAYPMSQGGLSGTVADPKLIYGTAIAITEHAKILKQGLYHFAEGIILAHCHPSGNTKPSQPDIDLTRKIKAGAQLLEMQLIDHVIVTPDSNSYYSFADEGLI